MTHFVRSACLQHFAAVVVAAGADPEPLIEASGFPRQAFLNPEMMLHAPQVAAFFEAAAQQTGLPDLGLRTGSLGGLAGFGFIGVMARDHETLGEAFRALLRMQNYLNTRARVEAVAAPETFDIHVVLQEPDAGRWRQLLEMTAAATVRLLDELAGRPVPVAYVSFRHARGAPLAAYRKSLRTEPFFGADAFVVSLDREVMAWKVQGAMPAFRTILDRVAEERGADGEPGLTALVEGNIAQLLRDTPTMESVATAMGYPPRSLQRLLAQSGTSFSKLLDKVRDREANAYLAQPGRSVAEIAFLLGFQSQSSFARWCKGHWGEAASVRRQRLLRARTPA